MASHELESVTDSVPKLNINLDDELLREIQSCSGGSISPELHPIGIPLMLASPSSHEPALNCYETSSNDNLDNSDNNGDKIDNNYERESNGGDNSGNNSNSEDNAAGFFAVRHLTPRLLTTTNRACGGRLENSQLCQPNFRDRHSSDPSLCEPQFPEHHSSERHSCKQHSRHCHLLERNSRELYVRTSHSHERHSRDRLTRDRSRSGFRADSSRSGETSSCSRSNSRGCGCPKKKKKKKKKRGSCGGKKARKGNAFTAFVAERLSNTNLSSENMSCTMKALSEEWRYMSKELKERYRKLAEIRATKPRRRPIKHTGCDKKKAPCC